jgi:hypothetical protein
MEGKGKEGSKRAHEESAYATPRTYFFCLFFSLWAPLLGSKLYKTIDAP